MSLELIEASLKEQAEELATAQSKSAEAEAEAWIKSAEHRTTGAQNNALPANQQPPPEPGMVPATRSQPKAPPPGVPRKLEFQNLAGTSEDSSDAKSAVSQASSAQSNAPRLDQQPRPEPATRDTQPTPQPSNTAQQQAATTQPRNEWADMTDASNGSLRSGDIRRRQDEQRQTQPNTGIFASKRFCNKPTSEKEYLKRWLLALQDQDWSIQKRWQEYCTAQADGTFDPLFHSTAFTRRFIFLYGGQPPHFFTQNQQIHLLPPQEEWRILRQYLAQYDATHLRGEPPASSWFWPPRPGAPSLTTPPTVSIAQHYQPLAAWPRAEQHPALPDRWSTQYTLPEWYPQPEPWEWSAPHHTPGSSWEGQQWYTAQQWSWAPYQWGYAASSWTGRWVWD